MYRMYFESFRGASLLAVTEAAAIMVLRVGGTLGMRQGFECDSQRLCMLTADHTYGSAESSSPERKARRDARDMYNDGNYTTIRKERYGQGIKFLRLCHVCMN